MKGKEKTLLKEFLKGIKIGKTQYADGLTVIPLFSNMKFDYSYITMDEGIRKNCLIIKEVETGIVHQVMATNTGKKDIFIMDGEEIVGAKQNRSVNISLIIPAETTIKIPVSCVEQRRWYFNSVCFKRSKNISYAELRKSQKATVLQGVREKGSYLADQYEVWKKIEERLANLNLFSETDAMNEIYTKEEKTIENYMKLFKVVKGQIGAIFGIGKDVFGMDIFDREKTFKKLFKKIIRSYIVEILSREKRGKVSIKKTEDFLKKCLKGKLSSHPSPGKGMTITIENKDILGTSLIANKTPVHTVIFNLHKK